MSVTLQPEVRLGRNFLRAGDICKVRLPGKSQFRSGFVFKGYDPNREVAVVKDPSRGHDRYVVLDAIQRVAQTRAGVRKESR